MKIILFQKKKKIAALLVIVFIVGVLLLNVVGYFLNMKYLSVFAATAEIDKYQVRSELLMEAMNNIGTCCLDKAPEIWASGLKSRSAAMQYSVMTKSLKDLYAKQLEETFPNWVTGVSSPWVDSFKIINKQMLDKNTYVFQLRFSTLTSTGPAGDYNATLTVIKDGEFWRISKIQADKELSVYTGFKP